MSGEIDYETIDANARALVDSETPAVTEEFSTAVAEPQHPANWSDLSDSQKLDILHMKVDRIGAQVAWIGQTFQGVIDMVGKVSPMDLFKMMRGGK